MASFKVDVTHVTTSLPGPLAQLAILPVSLEKSSDVPLDSKYPAGHMRLAQLVIIPK